MIIAGVTILYDVFIVDVGGFDQNTAQLIKQFPHAHVTRYFNTHLETIDRCMRRCRTSHAWIIFSCCDYQYFNFEYVPVPWEEHQLHCWASGDQKYGDTFLVPKTQWRQQKFDLLEWFRDVNYHSRPEIPRLPWPVAHYQGNDLTRAIVDSEFVTLYQWFLPKDTTITGTGSDPALWTKEHHQLVSFSHDNSISLVPREAKQHLSTQVYDYPYLCKTRQLMRPNQDIVFISYDETNADENWNQLKSQYPQAHRVHGVDGMENALQAAAEKSSTPWFYAVFAKTRLYPGWHFDHQPDYWQASKHYVFYAQNTSNDLVYGEMGVIMYHRDLVLEAPGFDQLGLDFTMSFPIAVIPKISAYGDFATDSYRAWRTAFREVLKLKGNTDVESQYRLDKWLTVAMGLPYGKYSIYGARDAVEYYDTVAGDFDALKKSYDWAWLASYALLKRNLTPNQ